MTTKWISLLIMVTIGYGASAQQSDRGTGNAGSAQARATGVARPGEAGFVSQFEIYDVNKNGKLSVEEVSNSRFFGPALFGAVDTDSDGLVSKSEALRADRIDTYKGPPSRIDFEGNKWISDHAISAEVLQYKGKKALHIVGREHCLVYLPIKGFENGTIEVDVAGDIFSGIVFRVREDGKRAEKLYFRPQNANTEKHLNTVQYAVIGREDGHWSQLRKTAPGKFENGANIKKGEWFHVRMEIKDEILNVFVDDHPDPVLTVDPLLDGITKGAVGVWGWDSYFANFRYTSKK